MQIEKNKLIQGMSFEEYAAVPAMNAGGLKRMMRSPAHYKAGLEVPMKETAALRFGKIFHTALLEPDHFKKHLIIEPVFQGYTQKGELTTNMNCKEVKMQYERFYANLALGQIVITEEEMVTITGMLNALLMHERAGPWLRGGIAEVSAFWDDPETGEQCKCRYDYLTQPRDEIGEIIDRFGLDIKTTINAKIDKFEKVIWSDEYLYYLQAAHYAEFGRVSKEVNPEAFIFIAIEKEYPHGISIHEISEINNDVGFMARKKLMKQFVECKKADKFEAYPADVNVSSPPKWLIERHMAGGL